MFMKKVELLLSLLFSVPKLSLQFAVLDDVPINLRNLVSYVLFMLLAPPIGGIIPGGA